MLEGWKDGMSRSSSFHLSNLPTFHRFSCHPEQLKPQRVPRHNSLPIRRVLRARQGRIARDDLSRGAARGLEQREIGREIGVAQRNAARLTRPGATSHPPLLEIELGDLEAVRRLGERL